MNCRYCGLKKTLVDSHIIPKCFYKPLILSKRGLKKFSSKEGDYPKRAPIGIYDSTILCQDCEKIFQHFDNYGCKILLHSKSQRKIEKDEFNNIIGYSILNIDYVKLKLFFMSILWRADISSREEFKKVKLGNHFAPLNRFIKTNNPGSYNDFSVILFEQIFLKDLPVMMIPDRVRFKNGLNFYELSLERFNFLIKADKRKIPDNLVSFVLQPKKPLPVPYVDFQGSLTEKRIQNIVAANKRSKKKI